MQKSIAVFLLAAVVALSTEKVMAGFVQPNLPPGSQYQLIFYTTNVTAATSSDIGYYNSFVQADAAIDPSLPSVTWNAIISTATIDAVTNAPNPELPVYDVDAYLVAPAVSAHGINNLYTDVYSGYPHPIGNEFGTYNAPYQGNIWSGGGADGKEWLGDFGVGTNQSGVSLAEVGTREYIGGGGSFNEANLWPVFALSAPLTIPIPEPATVTLLGSAVPLLVGWRLIHHRRIAVNRLTHPR